MVLREELMAKLSLSHSHHFSIFAEYRFWTSYRVSVQNLSEMRKNEVQRQLDENTTSEQLGIKVNMLPIKSTLGIPREDNLLIATWMDDPAYPQKCFEDKVLFHNNETLLEKDMNVHFDRSMPYLRNILQDREIEL